MRIVWSGHVPAQRRQKPVQGVCAGNNARPGSAVFVQRLFARVVEHWARGIVHGVRGRAVRQRVNRTLVDSALQCVRHRSASGKRRHELVLKAYGLQPRHVCGHRRLFHTRSHLQAVCDWPVLRQLQRCHVHRMWPRAIPDAGGTKLLPAQTAVRSRHVRRQRQQRQSGSLRWVSGWQVSRRVESGRVQALRHRQVPGPAPAGILRQAYPLRSGRVRGSASVSAIGSCVRAMRCWPLRECVTMLSLSRREVSGYARSIVLQRQNALCARYV